MKQIVLFKGNKSLLTRLALLVMMIVVGGAMFEAQGRPEIMFTPLR